MWNSLQTCLVEMMGPSSGPDKVQMVQLDGKAARPNIPGHTGHMVQQTTKLLNWLHARRPWSGQMACD